MDLKKFDSRPVSVKIEKIVKENDHLMDDTRYVVRGIEHAVIETTLDDKFSGFVPLDPGMGY